MEKRLKKRHFIVAIGELEEMSNCPMYVQANSADEMKRKVEDAWEGCGIDEFFCIEIPVNPYSNDDGVEEYTAQPLMDLLNDCSDLSENNYDQWQAVFNLIEGLTISCTNIDWSKEPGWNYCKGDK